MRVKTGAGWMCLASDASHYYENYLTRRPFPIVVDLQDMFSGFDTIQALASKPELVIPAMTHWLGRFSPHMAGQALSGGLMQGEKSPASILAVCGRMPAYNLPSSSSTLRAERIHSMPCGTPQ